MYKLTLYEQYIQSEIRRYGWPDNENDFPYWLVHENSLCYWMFRLNRSMYPAIWYSTVSKQMLKRIEHIPEIRFLKYRDISPVLMDALHIITDEFYLLREDLKDQAMWKRPYLLSWHGVQRWKKAKDIVYESMLVEPDPDWRENWEKEKAAPLCTRREAENIARDYLIEHNGIDLEEIDPAGNSRRYYYHMKAKNGLFKLVFGIWIDGRIGESNMIIVDMLSRKVIE